MIKLGIGFATLTLLAGVWFSWLTQHDRKIETKAVDKIVQASKNEGAIRAKKAQQKIDAAAKPGAVDRLRADPSACPDCGK